MPWANLQAEFEAAMRGATTNIASEERLNIYRANIILTLVDVLSETYRAVRMVVGDAYFDMLAKAFAQANPAQSGDLAQYGEAFPTFIDRHAVSKQLDYLSDLARFEWSWHRAFYAPDEQMGDWRQLPQDQLICARFHISEQLQLLTLHFDARALWEYCIRRNGEGTPPALTKSKYHFAVQRGKHGVQVDRLSDAEVSALQLLQRAETLEDALSGLEAAAIKPFFTLLLARPWITTIQKGVAP